MLVNACCSLREGTPSYPSKVCKVFHPKDFMLYFRARQWKPIRFESHSGEVGPRFVRDLSIAAEGELIRHGDVVDWKEFGWCEGLTTFVHECVPPESLQWHVLFFL
jgi:hypothetical protein